MRNYIITGAAGFIGSNLAKRLIKDGHNVYIIDNLSTGIEENIPKEAIFYKADASNGEALSALEFPKRIDCIYHLAAQSSGEASFDDPIRDINSNYRATYYLLNLAKKLDCMRFIFSSSMSVYGSSLDGEQIFAENHSCVPTSYYGANKLASEYLIKIFSKYNNLNSTIFRLFSVYGQGQNMRNMKQGIVSIYMSYLMRNMPIQVKGSLDRFRDVIHINDVVEALVLSEECGETYNEIFNLGTGTKTTVKSLLEAILDAYNKADFKEWVFIEGNTPGDVKGCVASVEKLEKALHWKPSYDVPTGVQEMKEWIDSTKSFWTSR